LCLAGRRSYLALLDVASSPACSNIVRMLKCLLGELERRDRDGFTLSLDTAGSPGQSPGSPPTDVCTVRLRVFHLERFVD
jgi:hypothetical protein